MRRLFIVLAKIFGLLQLYWALVTFMQVGFSFGVLLRDSVMEDVGQFVAGFVSTVIYFVMSLGVAWVLLVRTEWLADKLRVRAEGEPGEFREDAILRTGVKLIGVYILAAGIPSFVRTMLDSRVISGGMIGFHFWTKTIPTVLELALGILLAIRTESVLAFVAKAEQADGRRVFLTGFGILVVVLLLGLAVSSVRYGRYVTARSAPRDVAIADRAVIIHKDTNTPDAADWFTKPSWQPQTNGTGQEFLIITN